MFSWWLPWCLSWWLLVVTLMSFVMSHQALWRGFPGFRGVSSLCLFQKRLKGGLQRKVIWMLGSLGRGKIKKIVVWFKPHAGGLELSSTNREDGFSWFRRGFRPLLFSGKVEGGFKRKVIEIFGRLGRGKLRKLLLDLSPVREARIVLVLERVFRLFSCFKKKWKGRLEGFKSGALSKTAIYVPRFGCLVQKALRAWNCVCLGLAALFKRL